jgi:hypothetical protein
LRVSVWLAWAALALFCASLALPSVDFVILGKPGSLRGYHIVYFALGYGIAMLGQMASGTANAGSVGVDMCLASFAAAFNFLFLVVPLLLHRRMLAARGLAICALLGLTGLGAGAATPFVFGKSVAGIDIGFGVWLLSYVLLLLAIGLDWHARRAQPILQP